MVSVLQNDHQRILKESFYQGGFLVQITHERELEYSLNEGKITEHDVLL